MLTGIKMLLVDGDEGVRKALSLFFATRNGLLNTVENANQALMTLQKEPYDIIICEQLLPDMNGLTFFNILKNKGCEAINFLITSYGNNPANEEMHEAGIDFLLAKPFSGEEIEQTIIRLVKSKRIKSERL